MPPEAGGWIQWAVSLALGLIGGAWAARGMLATMQKDIAVHDTRIKALEIDREIIREMASQLAVVAALQGEMRDDVKEIFDRLNRRADDRQTGEERRHNGRE